MGHDIIWYGKTVEETGWVRSGLIGLVEAWHVAISYGMEKPSLRRVWYGSVRNGLFRLGVAWCDALSYGMVKSFFVKG